MTGSGVILEYSGAVDFDTIDILLKKIKNNPDFISFDLTTGKRVYAIIVESLENIAKHSILDMSAKNIPSPFLTVVRKGEKVLIKAGNPVYNEKKARLVCKLEQVNNTHDDELLNLYIQKINRETRPEMNGAGLGLIMMKTKSGNNIKYSFRTITDEISFFEIEILVNKFIMRKLVIEKTASSPKVVLDPDKRFFEISGESRPPDVGSFYGEIQNWLEDYSAHLVRTQDTSQPVVFNFDLEYFNSSSAKYILDFCKQMANVRSKGQTLEVKWHYEKDDADMLEVGREMSRISKLPFDFVEKGG